MRKTTDTSELTIDELNLVSGGDFNMGMIGSMTYVSSPEGGSSVTWPGAVGGVQGSWTASSKNGLTWRPA
ncbi:hypothetical protein [Bradyrhizobium sp.]|uniref:hypothetical protein n=1 Tax=Bradyrhizobium sp. TaxID=376 RepID=UPI003BAEB391